MALKLIKTSKEEDNSNILKGLNDNQKLAVTNIDNPLLIIAGAGSGKTRVLTHRIAYMVEHGIRPYNILALTFTNKAAKEMKDRIINIVSSNDADKIWAGTFHSIFAKILRYEAEHIGFTSSFSIYDTDDSISVIKGSLEALNIDSHKYTPQSIHAQISSAKNRNITWQKYSMSASSMFEKIIAKVYEAYQNKLIASNSMDFDDLLSNIINLFVNSKEVLEKYQDRFKYILVDEYQDTNKAQYTAINLLASKYKNLCVVGDDAQSIYRWRGADIHNILDFQKDYPNATTIRLEQNYRSTKTILSAADSVIKNNRKQLTKTLWTDNPEGDKIDLITTYNDYEESQKIAQIIKLKLTQDYSPKDIAILYRTNAQSLSHENALRADNIPYIIIGGMSFYKRKEIKDVISYLKLLFNKDDDESLKRIANEPPRGLGATSMQHIAHYANYYKISLLQAFHESEQIGELQKRAMSTTLDFYYLIDDFAKQIDNTDPYELVEKFITKTGILQMYNEMNTEDSLDRWNNINQLLSDIKQFFQRNPEETLQDYLQQISLIADIDSKDTSANQVKLMTLHSAKGLEFPIVFISGLEDGLFPFSKSKENQDDIEEERRLFYVGITRAMEHLYLTNARQRMRFGELSASRPSEFLKEIDSRLIQDFNAPARISKKLTTAHSLNNPKPTFFHDIPLNESYSQIQEDVFELKVGNRVSHKQFGVGKVKVLIGQGDKQQALVDFVTVGKKHLMLKFAKLTKID